MVLVNTLLSIWHDGPKIVTTLALLSQLSADKAAVLYWDTVKCLCIAAAASFMADICGHLKLSLQLIGTCRLGQKAIDNEDNVGSGSVDMSLLNILGHK